MARRGCMLALVVDVDDPSERAGAAEASDASEPSSSRRLYREPDDKRVAGVCAGVGDYIGVDPTIVRLATVLLVLVNGLGVVAYLIAWLVVPERPPHVPRARRTGTVSWARFEYPAVLVLLGITAALVLFAPWTRWSGRGTVIVGLALLALGIWLLVASRQNGAGATTQSGTLATLTGGPGHEHPYHAGQPDAGVPSASDPGSTPGDVSTEDASGGDGGRVGVTPGGVPPPAPPGGHLPPEDETPSPAEGTRGDGDASRVLAVVLLVAGVLALLAVTGAVRASVGYVVAAALVTVGLLLIVDAWRGRTRWLIWLGLPLVAVLAVADAVDVPWHAGVGERNVLVEDRAALTDEHRLLAGEYTIDLRSAPLHGPQVPWSRVVTLDAAVGAGELIIILPETASAEVTARVRAGEIDPAASDRHDAEGGLGVRRELRLDADGEQSRVRLDLRVGFGEIQIRREPDPQASDAPTTTEAPTNTVPLTITTTTTEASK